jgi:hypothetical protein
MVELEHVRMCQTSLLAKASLASDFEKWRITFMEQSMASSDRRCEYCANAVHMRAQVCTHARMCQHMLHPFYVILPACRTTMHIQPSTHVIWKFILALRAKLF